MWRFFPYYNRRTYPQNIEQYFGVCTIRIFRRNFIGYSLKFGALRLNFGAQIHKNASINKKLVDNMESLKRLPRTTPELVILAVKKNFNPQTPPN